MSSRHFPLSIALRCSHVSSAVFSAAMLFPPACVVLTRTETMDLAALAPSARPLGMHCANAVGVALTIPPFTLALTQSPSLLRSNAAQGTTGAVLWSITPHLARYLLSPRTPFSPLLTSTTTVLELGCGVAAVLAATLGTRVGSYLQSDLASMTKLAALNLAANLPPLPRRKPANYHPPDVSTIDVDWENTDLPSHPALRTLGRPLGMVIASDCVYNEGLVPAFVDTLEAACKLHRDGDESEAQKTVVLVAQETRSPDVMECFLTTFMERFVVYRVPDDKLSEELRGEKGYVLHVGILKDDGRDR